MRAGITNLGDSCVASGDAVLDYYGLAMPYGGTVGVLIAYLAVLHVLTFAALDNAARRARSKG